MSDHTSDSPLVQLSFDDIEHWRDVPGFEGIYAVSDKGRVMRTSSASNYKAGSILRGGNLDGYLIVHLRKNGTRTDFLVHRLVMLVFVGSCPVGKQVNHKNGIRTDNRLENLEYVTPTENMLHSFHVLGRRNNPNKGSASNLAKLTEDQIHAIKHLLTEGQMTQASIARQFGVSDGLISMIKDGRVWKHLD